MPVLPGLETSVIKHTTYAHQGEDMNQTEVGASKLLSTTIEKPAHQRSGAEFGRSPLSRGVTLPLILKSKFTLTHGGSLFILERGPDVLSQSQVPGHN